MNVSRAGFEFIGQTSGTKESNALYRQLNERINYFKAHTTIISLINLFSPESFSFEVMFVEAWSEHVRCRCCLFFAVWN